MIKEQSKVLKVVKEKFLQIDRFKLIDENEKAIQFDFEGTLLNVEAQLDKSNTFTSIFITDNEQVLTSNDLLKKINFTDEDTLNGEIKMASILVNEIPIIIYQIVNDVKDGYAASRKYNFVMPGFEKIDYRTYVMYFTVEGRNFLVNLEQADLMYNLIADVSNLLNEALIEDINTMTLMVQNHINNIHRL